MKLHFALFCLFALPAAWAEPEFVGILSSSESGTQFVVAPQPNGTPRWVKTGDWIAGYLVADFRPQEEVLVFKKDGREFSVKLKSSKVQHDYRGQSLPFTIAKQLIASDPQWRGDVSYEVFQDEDGAWSLAAARRTGRAIQFRFLPLTPESIPTDMRSRE
jgi:hypothetical protein